MKKTCLLSLVCICVFTINTEYALALARQLNDTYTLQTDDTLISLVVKKDGLFISRFSNGPKGWNWVGGISKISMPQKTFCITGFRELKWELEDVKAESDHGGRKVKITFGNRDPLIKAHSVWRAHPGPGPIEHTLKLKNPGDKSIEITWAPSLSLSLESLPQSKLQHWWVEKSSRVPTPYGTHISTIEDGFNYSGLSTTYDESHVKKKKYNEPVPWQCIHCMAGKHGFYTGIESSGCIMQKTSLKSDHRTLVIELGIDTTLGAFQAVLQPKEIYTFPTVFAGCYKGDVEDGSNRLHRWTKKWLLAPSNKTELPLIVNNSWGSQTSVGEAMAKRMIDDCADIGIEMYHLDAGWYKAVGWWHDDPNKFPNRLKTVSDYAHSKGLKFGLWVAWPHGGHTTVDTEALSVFHPDMKGWFRKDMPADWTSPMAFRGEPVCLASESAVNWCIKETSRIVQEYGIDMLEHDQQILVQNCTRKNHGHTGSPGDISHRAAQGYYKVHKSLLEKFPNLLIENCMNGGRMIDFGVIKYCHYVCSSDSYNPLSFRKAFYDLSLPMPPGIIEGYIAGNKFGPKIENFKYTLRSMLLGWCTIMADTSKWNDLQKKTAKHHFDIYKKLIRPQIRNGNLYRLSSRPEPHGWDAFQYHTPSNGRGVVFVFRADCGKSDLKLKLEGLKVDSRYEVSFEDGYGKAGVFTGKELMSKGLQITLPCMQSSELVYLAKRKR
ncbi:MAG: alpha-galactosidase [Planctomycetota bacterium]|jgi:alpha-galactosidase